MNSILSLVHDYPMGALALIAWAAFLIHLLVRIVRTRM